MSKEIFGRKLNAGQRAHIVGGLSENAAVNASYLKNIGSASKLPSSMPNVFSAIGGSLLMAGGIFTAIKGYKLMRNASGLHVNYDNVEKALDESGVLPTKELTNDFMKNLRSSLYEQGVCNEKGFVNPDNRLAVKDPNFAEGKSIAIGSHFNQAVKSAMANSGFDISDKNKDAIESLTKSIAQDLGFIYSNKDGQTSLVSYDGKNAKMDNAYNPKELEHKDQGILKDTSPKQQKAFLSAMETSGIIDNGQVVKAASRSQIIGCCKVAGIHINSDSREMQNSIKHLQEKAKSVAIVPSWNDRVNMNKKLEAGFIGAVGTSSAILGAVSILAMFSGFAVLAAASMAVTFAGITIASSLVVRDAVNEASASIKNNNLTNAHKELKEEALNKFKTAKTDKEKQGARSEFVEHQMQEKLYNIRAQENAGISGANTIFMASIAIAAITVLGLFGGIGAGMAALATGASFIAGTGVMVGTKKYFGKEANHVSRDLKEFDNLVKNRQEGKLVDSQIQRLEELETKYINQEIQDIEAEIDTKINVDNPAYKKEAKPTLDVNNSKSQQAAPGNNTTPEQKIVELLGNHNNNIKCPIREGLKSVKLQGKKTLEESKATKHKSEENNKEGDNISI